MRRTALDALMRDGVVAYCEVDEVYEIAHAEGFETVEAAQEAAVEAV